MLLDAVLLIQDVQLLCFTVVFGLFAMQRWSDRTRVWLWSTFLANGVGAVLDLAGSHLPAWLSKGVNMEMIPLSYALLNVTLACFDRRDRRTNWLSFALLLAALPFFLAWRNEPGLVHSYALGDLLISLECLIAMLLFFSSKEQATREPRVLMGSFLALFAILEAARFALAFPLHTNPDSVHWFLVTCTVAYIVNTSLLPLAFIWMMHTRLESELRQQSRVDALTGVLNRRGLEEALARELAIFERDRKNFSIGILDLDHFKVINDRYGHVAGDAFLTKAVNVLRAHTRATDIIARFGGDEFILLMPGTSTAEAGRRFVQLCKAIRDYSGWVAGEPVNFTASIGFTNTDSRQNISNSGLLREADAALYQAKHNGRDQARHYETELVNPAPG
ncbi:MULTISPECIES: GGDEF domain-containing protein [Acidobacterium]|nr:MULTISPECIES: GGDEF domain-containing protein [Acidobacterium]HCT59833.1 GGDEF domain-containing protein [Acidobacterium sp.]